MAALDGTDLPEMIFGTVENDVITGIDGDDILWGVDGRDMLIGGNGDDTLSGGSGNDTLDGGSGEDFFYGGSGIDLVSYESATASVSINILNAGLNRGDSVGDFFLRSRAMCLEASQTNSLGQMQMRSYMAAQALTRYCQGLETMCFSAKAGVIYWLVAQDQIH